MPYFEPCVIAREGVVRIRQNHAETTQLFTPVDEQYRARGFKRGDYAVLDLRDLGPSSALATLRWAYKDEAGNTIWETAFSYNLYRQDNAWKILVQTMHDE